MKPNRRRVTGALTLVVLAACPTWALACATCGCALSTEAAMGYSAEPGWRASFEFDFINQDQLRTGTSSISNARVAAINDAGGSQEVEKQTINRYFTFGLNYIPNPDWNLNLLVPFIDRSHDTYGQAMNPLTPDQISGASVESFGDMRFIASYQGLLPTHNLGIQLGLRIYPRAGTADLMLTAPASLGATPSHSSPGPIRRTRRQTISSTPACKPASAPRTSLSAGTTTRP